MTDMKNAGMERLPELAAQCGFDHWGPLNMDSLIFRPEVREMCAEGKCSTFGTSWSCPPGCGTLEEIRERAKSYGRGFLVQTTGNLEDDFDYESMMDTERVHKEHFLLLAQQVRQWAPDCWPMTAGGCRLCETCTYPDAPCRQPQRMLSSMEACGLFVSDVCRQSGLAYNYGSQTITFTSCILLR